MNTLAILICTLPERANKLSRLLDVLKPQVAAYSEQVSYHLHDAGMSMPTGQKRNELINQTQSDYFVFIDDDDLVSSRYVEYIVQAMEQSPDVITFNGWITTNGGNRKDWTIRLGSKYEERNGKYYRWPNHIVPMRREAVRRIAFPEVWQQEDYLWSKKIHELGLLKTEVHIPYQLYHYDCYTKSAPERRIRR